VIARAAGADLPLPAPHRGHGDEFPAAVPWTHSSPEPMSRAQRPRTKLMSRAAARLTHPAFTHRACPQTYREAIPVLLGQVLYIHGVDHNLRPRRRKQGVLLP
jgi:hypothetical protein